MLVREIYLKFSHDNISIRFNGKKMTVMLELSLYVIVQKQLYKKRTYNGSLV